MYFHLFIIIKIIIATNKTTAKIYIPSLYVSVCLLFISIGDDVFCLNFSFIWNHLIIISFLKLIFLSWIDDDFYD